MYVLTSVVLRKVEGLQPSDLRRLVICHDVRYIAHVRQTTSVVAARNSALLTSAAMISRVFA